MYLIRDIDKSQDYIITVQNMDGPLKNLLVLDLTRVLVGPYCTMMLSDLGARVIKVEAPEVGDDSRKFGPFIEDYSAYFMSLNRGKESIALNLKNEDDKKIFDKILAKADILVENFKPGTLEKWGYGWKDINKKYELNEIVKGDSIFCATGITNSEILKGITINNNEYISETLVTHKSSDYKEIIKNINLIDE